MEILDKTLSNRFLSRFEMGTKRKIKCETAAKSVLPLIPKVCLAVFIIFSMSHCSRDPSQRADAEKYSVKNAPATTLADSSAPPASRETPDDKVAKAPKTDKGKIEKPVGGEIRNDDGLLVPVDDSFVLRVELTGTLLDTLLKAMPDNLRVCRALASEAEEALHFQMDTRKQMSVGDVATLVFKEGGRNAVARLYGVRYFSRLLDRKLFAYYFWETNKPYPEYFDADGVSLTPRLKRPPLREYQRIGSLAGRNPMREGVFFLAEPETEVVAPFKSKVVRINWLPKDTGDCVELFYEGTGVSAVIKGLGSLSVKVNPGAVIKSGGVIGRVATPPAGKAGGFRYLVRSGIGDGAIGVDPFRFHMTTKYTLDKTSRGFFLSVKQRIDSHLARLDQVLSELGDSSLGDSEGSSGG
jgi:hypothetical protein